MLLDFTASCNNKSASRSYVNPFKGVEMTDKLVVQLATKRKAKRRTWGWHFHLQQKEGETFVTAVTSQDARLNWSERPEGCELTFPMSVTQALEFIQGRKHMIPPVSSSSENPGAPRPTIHGIILKNQGGETIHLSQPV